MAPRRAHRLIACVFVVLVCLRYLQQTASISATFLRPVWPDRSRFSCAMAAAGAGSADPAATFPEAVLWDVDGTLVDSTLVSWKSTNEVLQRHGYPEITVEGYEEGCIYPTPRRMAFHALKEDLDDPEGLKLAKEFDDLYIDLVTPETVPLYPGVRELLENLKAKGYRFGALSNACGRYVKTVLTTHGLSEMFEAQLGADEVPAAKPAADGLLQVCKGMGVSPANCVYIGDAPTDGKAARNANMHGIGVLWGSHDNTQVKENADEVVETAEELLQRIAVAVTA
eukprot:TRINITY_DN9917_c0_g1_i3.p1 TRINITY_DN9917_c0_g1~~TRINITY_DN9917_c0_g1_i3.p1  ORF type:complete len:294 (+),score=58.57 TRINITY_DN9917_c0_g1_i3:35-883(+)